MPQSQSQSHSHPVLRDQGKNNTIVNEVPQKDQKEIVPVDDPLSTSSKQADRDRWLHIKVQYADVSLLEEIRGRFSNICEKFPHKAVLYIGSERYDYPTVTILEGLSTIGFNVYTLKKGNVSSWFCNTVIDSTSGLEVDFVLSNVGWGTRWSYYTKYRLTNRFPNVLVNNVDGKGIWRDTIKMLNARYDGVRPENSDEMNIQPYLWTEDVPEKYDPIVFSTHVRDMGGNEIYLPYGMHGDILTRAIPKSTHDRYIPLLRLEYGASFDDDEDKFIESIPIDLFYDGETIVPTAIAGFISQDDSGKHGWSEWVQYNGYVNKLCDCQMIVHESDKHRFFWDTLAYGCLPFVLENRCVGMGMNDYPVSSLFPFTVVSSLDELRNKYEYLVRKPTVLDKMRQECHEGNKFFSPVSLAERFLWYVNDRIN